MRKKSRKYQSIRTRAEMRENGLLIEDGVRIKWGRGRRNKAILDPWCNERHSKHQKSWKMFRAKQYHCGGRGKKHILKMDSKTSWFAIWRFEEYCRNHDIPFEVRRLHHLEWYWQYKIPEWVVIKWVPYLYLEKVDGKWTSVEGVRPEYGYRYFPLEAPIRRYRRIDDGYELVWWSNKDIGIDYVLS